MNVVRVIKKTTVLYILDTQAIAATDMNIAIRFIDDNSRRTSTQVSNGKSLCNAFLADTPQRAYSPTRQAEEKNDDDNPEPGTAPASAVGPLWVLIGRRRTKLLRLCSRVARIVFFLYSRRLYNWLLEPLAPVIIYRLRCIGRRLLPWSRRLPVGVGKLHFLITHK